MSYRYSWDAWARGICPNDQVDVLDSHLGQNGFQNTRLRRHENRRRDCKRWADDYLMVWDELDAVSPPRAHPDAPLTRQTWLDLFAAAVKETEKVLSSIKEHTSLPLVKNLCEVERSPLFALQRGWGG
jgi:hypothetical protein